MADSRHAVAARSLVAAVVWILWCLSIAVSGEESATSVVRVLAGAVAGLAAGILLGGVLVWLLSLRKEPVGRALHAAARALAGGIAGLTLAASLPASNPDVGFPAAMMVVVPAIACPWLLDAMEQVYAARAAVLEQRAALVRDAATLSAASATQAKVVADVRATIAAAVESELAPAREGVARRLAALDAGGTAELGPGDAGDLRDVTQDSLRPLIRTLNAADAAQAEPLGIGGAIRAIIRTQPFHPTPLAVLYVLTTLPDFWIRQGAVEATLNVAIGVGAIFAILGAGNAVMRRGVVRHDVAFMVTFGVLQIPTVVYSLVTVGMPEAAVSSVASVLVSAALVLLTSSLGSWRDRQEASQQTFRDLLDAERIDTLARSRVAAEVARQAALALHGPVQARLAACAVALEEAGRAGDSAGQIAALQNADQALRFRLFDDSPPRVQGLPEVLAAAAAPWEGLVDIRLETSGEQPSPEAIEAIEQVVEESITNAVRHGGARQVVVLVEGSPDGHRITVDDDGRGALEPLPGIGLTLYQRVTRGHWELTRSDALNGARLTALVPR